ncbi:hypothetical protein O181_004306 [Austropuccinia psidii MF-1]|uniref:Uncharacterized protein n=1 Tax=Austropuccinia psidii MF-1 TaxID=1389203 RepID=A0A9Q3GEW8_9BASI|nr:hypothetical protein [Austropuccinia psidii MF-1]
MKKDLSASLFPLLPTKPAINWATLILRIAKSPQKFRQDLKSSIVNSMNSASESLEIVKEIDITDKLPEIEISKLSISPEKTTEKTTSSPNGGSLITLTIQGSGTKVKVAAENHQRPEVETFRHHLACSFDSSSSGSVP